MKIECTPQELKELIKKEQTENQSECSVEKVITNLSDELNNALSTICDTELKDRLENRS